MSAADRESIRYDPPLIVPWSAVGLMAIAFILLGLATRGPNTLAIDLEVSIWVQQWSGPVGETIAEIGNFLGEATLGLSLLAIAWVGFALLRRRRELWFTLILAIERLIATQLKDLLDSPRPSSDQVRHVGTFEHWGFPSGHVTTAALSLGAIAWTIARFFPAINLRLLGILWAIGVATCAWARIWYGAHWFSDAIGGALAGAIFVALASNLSFALTRADRATFRRRSPAQTPPPSPPPTG
ncbi:MAG TPA: phosphatase PAP2 family protein [Thermomicrobiales bacterium]|nr:phosphatase PAP2 family protein [Thermomicrobiales bacterium]